MNSTDIQSDITKFISEQLLSDRPDFSLVPDDDLLGENLLDSMAIMRLVTFIDERYQYAVPPADVTIENFLTVRDIARYLESHVNNSG